MRVVSGTLAVVMVFAIRLGYGPFLLHVLPVVLKGFGLAALFEALVP
jgi:hypothetical protein